MERLAQHLKGFIYLKWHSVAYDVKAGSRQLMRYGFDRNDLISLCHLTLVISFHSCVVADGKPCRFSKGPSQVFVTVFLIGCAFLFAVTVASAANTAATNTCTKERNGPLYQTA